MKTKGDVCFKGNGNSGISDANGLGLSDGMAVTLKRAVCISFGRKVCACRHAKSTSEMKNHILELVKLCQNN